MPEAEEAPDEEPDVIVERRFALIHHVATDDDPNSRLEDHYAIGRQIGIGRGVHICRHKRTGHKRALKSLPKVHVSPERFQQEISALRTVDHPNLLRLFESFEDHHYYYIITELSTAGNLYDYLAHNYEFLDQTLGEAHMAMLMKQILICVNHCHKLNIIHCDIKPENILLERDDVIFERLILADFGFAQFYEAETRMTRLVGTPEYWAPEVFRRSYGPKCDVWAVGVLAFLLLTGELPFLGKSDNARENAKELYNEIQHRRDHFDLDIWNGRSQEGKLFVQHLLTIDETERPTAEEALRHPWFELIQESQSTQASSMPDLDKLVEFSARQKLKQATYAYLVAHRTFKSRKKVIDQVFRRVDTNSDGLISQREIEESFHDQGQLLTREELNDIFARVDMDKNGYINYFEFLAATSRAESLCCEENLRIAFDAFDRNKNGSIGVDEIRRLFYNHRRQGNDGEDDVDESVIDAIIRQVDTNGDKEISYEEFETMMQENLLTHKRSSDRSDESEDDNYPSQRQRSC